MRTFISFYALQTRVRQPGLEAQVNVVCHKTKSVSVLLKEEPNVPLLVI